MYKYKLMLLVLSCLVVNITTADDVKADVFVPPKLTEDFPKEGSVETELELTALEYMDTPPGFFTPHIIGEDGKVDKSIDVETTSKYATVNFPSEYDTLYGDVPATTITVPSDKQGK